MEFNHRKQGMTFHSFLMVTQTHGLLSVALNFNRVLLQNFNVTLEIILLQPNFFKGEYGY